jgi:hypothetical protein
MCATERLPHEPSDYLWIYTPEQQGPIFEHLCVSDEEAGWALAQIGIAIALTRPDPLEPTNQSAEADLRRRRLPLSAAIDRVIKELEELRDDPILSFVPDLEGQLKLLRTILPGSNRRRGGLTVGRNQSMMELVEVLANLWLKHRGEQPGWTKDPDSGELIGPFRLFVSLCTTPAGFDITDSVFLRGIKRWRDARTKPTERVRAAK